MQRTISAINGFIEKYIIYLFVSCIFIGLLLGDRLSFVGSAVQFFLIFMVSFTATLKITFSRFKASVNIPLLILMFIFTQMMYPAVAWIYCRLFYSNGGILNDFGVGIMLIYSIPCAVSLAIWVILARGDAGLSFVFVVLDNLLGFMLTPVLMKLYCAQSVEFNSFAMMGSLFIQVILPSFLGILVSTIDEKMSKGRPAMFLDKPLPYIKLLSKVCLFGLVTISSSRSATSLFNTLSWKYLGLVFSCAFLNFFSFVLSSAVFLSLRKALKIDRKSVVAATYGCSMKNCGTATVFAGMYLPPLAIVPCVIDLIEINIVASMYTKLFDKVVKEDPECQSEC